MKLIVTFLAVGTTVLIQGFVDNDDYIFGDNTQNVKFKYGNRDCKWSELGSTGNHERTLRVNCKKLGKLPQLSCQYQGDPHKCPGYGNKGKVAWFYVCLINKLTKNEEGLCNAASVFCNKCPDVIFNKNIERSGNNLIQRLLFERVDIVEDTNVPTEDKWNAMTALVVDLGTENRMEDD